LEILEIKSTKTTPDIMFDLARGQFEIKGISIPNHPAAFYDPIIQWLKGFSLHAANFNQVVFKLNYLDSDSNLFLIEILRLFKEISDNDKEVRVFKNSP